MRTRIFKIITETADDGKPWRTVCIAAQSADGALKTARKGFSKAIEERLFSIEVLASSDEDE